MTSALDVLELLEGVGFDLHVEANSLRVSPRSRLTEEFRATIKAHKEPLCELLRERLTAEQDSVAGKVTQQTATSSEPPSPRLAFKHLRLIKTVPKHFAPDGLVAGAILPVYGEIGQDGRIWARCRSCNYVQLEPEYWEPIFD